MLQTKVIKNIITITDPVEMYSPLDLTLMSIFNKQYKGRCNYGSYIIECLSILERGSACIDNVSLDAYCQISVAFLCKVFNYERGDLAFGIVKTIEANGDTIITNEFSTIKIYNTEKVTPITIGKLIPCFIDDCRYSPFQTAITAIAHPFIPRPHNIIYRVSENDTVMDNFSSAFEMITNIEEKIAPHDKKNVAFFRELLYPHKTNRAKKSKDLSDIFKCKVGDIVSRPSTLYLISGFVNVDEEDDLINMPMPLSLVAKEFIYGYIKELNALLTLVENFNQKDYAPYWAAYKANKV